MFSLLSFVHTCLPPPPCLVFFGSLKLPSCPCIYSKGALIPGTGCEVLGASRQRRWGRVCRLNGTCPAWSNITGSGCRVGSVDPHRLSTERISEARFGFSAASSVSQHEAFGLQPLPLVQIPQEKVLLTGLEVTPQTPRWRSPVFKSGQILFMFFVVVVLFVFLNLLRRGNPCLCSTALTAVALFLLWFRNTNLRDDQLMYEILKWNSLKMQSC